MNLHQYRLMREVRHPPQSARHLIERDRCEALFNCISAGLAYTVSVRHDEVVRATATFLVLD